MIRDVVATSATADEHGRLRQSRDRLNSPRSPPDHPIGASGACTMATLISALERQGARRGIATLCIGGGEATAVAVELVD